MVFIAGNHDPMDMSGFLTTHFTPATGTATGMATTTTATTISNTTNFVAAPAVIIDTLSLVFDL